MRHRWRWVILAAFLVGLALTRNRQPRQLVPEASDSAVPVLDTNRWYEVCPDCGGEGSLCTTCWDEGLVPHACGSEHA